MKTARVIITFECVRDCLNCCNKNREVLGEANRRGWCDATFKELAQYDEVCITGGEPMISPSRVLSLSDAIYHYDSEVRIYSYSAWYRDLADMKDMLARLDGIHYTLHSPISYDDLQKFYRLQNYICECNLADERNSSGCRLNIEHNIDIPINVVPSAWDRIENKSLIPDVCLPENETLYILE
jgi:organic radical activating enzyme